MCIVGANDHNDLTNPDFIIISDDDGKTWTRVLHEFVVAGWNDVSFISDDKIIAVGFDGRAIMMEVKR